MRHLLIVPAVCAALLPAGPRPGAAMAILQSTWEEAGGSDDDPLAGFSRNMALAAEDPFASTVKIVVGDGESHGSGVFVGQDDEGRDLVLTAAHVVDAPDNEPSFTRDPAEVSVVSGTGETYAVAAILIDPDYRLVGLSHDIAVVTLEPSADKPSLAGTRTGKPYLYCSSTLPEGPATIVGYGGLGTGTLGVQRDWGDPDAAVAVHNVIDGRSVEPDEAELDPDPAGEAPAVAPLYTPGTGDMLVLDFDGEDGDENGLSEAATQDLRLFGTTFDSDPEPADPFEGTMLSGDSGGPVFMEVGGSWVIVGVVSHGDEDARYGATQNMADPFSAFVNTDFPTIEALDDEGEETCP